MEYSIRKDETPENTVKRIKKILDKLGIEIEIIDVESGQSHFCVVLKIKNFDKNIRANGKGSCFVNAVASAHAEFIERMQTGLLIQFNGEKFCYAADEKIEKFSLRDNRFKKIIQENNLIVKEGFEVSKLAEEIFSLKNINEANQIRIIFVPFLSYKTRSIRYFPSFLKMCIQGSNGFAAGNTFEEASVQGLSEVIERYCAKQIFVKKISMPNIPKEYYEQYENIMGLIKEIENLGYGVTLKDASLDNNFPAICAIFEDKICPKNGVVFKFGAHPYFPIALERSLTEFLQGNSEFEKYRKCARYIASAEQITLRKIITNQFRNERFLKKTNQHIKKILTNKPDYEFSKGTWLFNEEIDNKTMFNNLAKLVLRHTDDIYIRNCSFLGFPTVSIYANEFSNPIMLSEKKFYYERKIQNIFCSKNQKIENETIEEILDLYKYIVFELPSSDFFQTNLKENYLGFLCAILLNNKKYIKKFLNVIIGACCVQSSSKNTDTRLHLYQAYLKYFKLYYTNTPKEKIQEIIEKKYSKIIYLEIIKTLESLNEDKIKQMISDEINNTQKQPNIFNDERIKQLGNKLHNIYAKNIPNQNEILKIIEGYKPTIKDRIKNLFIS
ncbi:MAG: YcaO-like family protein [Candidatus Gastranaerophilales bacterium]|nr:YcaO-like family protein [Candidatus Gastranaerophilales bacterium]